MKRVNIDVLKKGDIILTTSDHTDSKLVRFGTNSDISHAMLCVSRGSVMDSTKDGVHARNIDKLLYNDHLPMYVLRLKEELANGILDRVVDYIRSVTGTSYGLLEAGIAATPAPRWFKKSPKQFCSRLVAEAYASVGVELYKSPSYCSPANLLQSGLLYEVKDAIVSSSVHDQRRVRETGDFSLTMIEITSGLLEQVRALVHVESLNDIDTVVREQPALDSRVCDIFHTSGYFDFWMTDVERFPWRYDLVELTKFYYGMDSADARRAELIAECRGTLQDDKSGVFRHWYMTWGGYRQLNQHFPSIKLFQLQFALYTNLTLSHRARVEVARAFLLGHAARSIENLDNYPSP